MSFATAQTTVGTTATEVATISAVPDSAGILVYATAAVYVGGSSSVTTTSGFPIPATTPVLIPTSGADTYTLYAIAASGTPTVSAIWPA